VNFRWTDAGRAALSSAEHVGLAAVTLTHFAIGDAHGPGGSADDARTALRNERHRAPLTGSQANAGQIAVRGDFAPDASYGISEAGIFGTHGDPPGASELLLYWTANGALSGQAAAGTSLSLVAVIDLTAATADVNVTVSPTIVLGSTSAATEQEFGTTRYATDLEAAMASVNNRSLSPKGLLAALGKILGSLFTGGPADGTKYILEGEEDGKLKVVERTQDSSTAASLADHGTRIAAVEGKTGDASDSAKGIVELATSQETKTGTDTARAVTPKGLRDAAPETVASLLPQGSSIAQGKRYVLEGLANSGLKLVASTALLAFCGDLDGMAQSAVVVGSALEVDGATEWTIPATGKWGITEMIAWSSNPHGDTTRSQSQLTAESRVDSQGKWAAITGGMSMIDYRGKFASAWWGRADLSAGAQVRFKWGPKGLAPDTATVELVALNIAQI